MNKSKLVFLVLVSSLVPSSAQVRGYLKTAVMEGDGAFNDIKRGTAHPPVVQVNDETNNQVAGAQVTFLLPAVGAGGKFSDGGRTFTTTSDAQGVARCPAFKPNQTEGRFPIKVSASYEGKTGGLVLSQSNTLAGGSGVEKKSSGSKKFLILALLGGAAAAGVAVAAHGGGSHAAAAPVPAVTLSPGGVTVGAPK